MYRQPRKLLVRLAGTYIGAVPAKKKTRKPPRRKRLSAQPKMSARYDMVMHAEEKAELEAATVRLGFPSLARFLVAAGLKMAREQK